MIQFNHMIKQINIILYLIVLIAEECWTHVYYY